MRGLGVLNPQKVNDNRELLVKKEMDMKRMLWILWIVFVCVFSLRSPTLVFAQSSPVAIIELNVEKEYVLIQNVGDTSVNLNGWVLHDHDYGKGSVYSYTFSETTLEPGEILHMQSGKTTEEDHEATHNHDECTYYIRWSDRNVWNNTCDIAYVLDEQGTIMAEGHAGKDLKSGNKDTCQ